MHTAELIFYPVGQGLFAAGHLSDYGHSHPPQFTWVYDCGTTSSGNLVGSGIDRIAAALGGGTKPTLDLVVVSHFDHDHISGLVALLTRFHVRDLVIPLIPLWQRLDVLFRTRSYVERAALSFMLDPIGAVSRIPGAEVDRIILVPPSAGDAVPPDTDDLQPDDLGPEGEDGKRRLDEDKPFRIEAEIEARSTIGTDDRGGDGSTPDLQGRPNVRTLKPGGRLSVRGLWEFVPYNDARLPKPADAKFVCEAERKRNVLMADSDEKVRKAALKALKEHYEKTYKTSEERNVISLFLYAGSTGPCRRVHCGCRSGPLRRPRDGLGRRYLSWSCIRSHRRASVLYTGDGYLNTADRWNRLAQYLGPARVKELLALQVMHHGARGNWCPGLAASIHPDIAVFSSDPDHKRFRHPHDEVVKDFESRSRIARVNRHQGVGFTAVW